MSIFALCFLELAEACLSLPVSNAWPEQGASCTKRLKTCLCSTLKNDMPEALMHIAINGPGQSLIHEVAKQWLAKPRRHLAKIPAKNLPKKSKAAGTDLYLALLAWRNTPSEGQESSPSQRMFGRHTRTLLPMTSELLKPKIVENVRGKLLKRKQLQAKHYNISAKELPHLSKGEIVHVKPTDRSGRWFKACVEQQVDVRSYEVRTEDGKIFRRNRRHLRNSKEPAYTRGNPEPIHMPEQTPVGKSRPPQTCCQSSENQCSF